MPEKGKIPVDEALIYFVNSDPTAGGGFEAVVGSILMRDDGSFYNKTGLLDTDWTQFISSSMQTFESNYIDGFQHTFNTVTTFDVGDGECRDSTDAEDMAVSGGPTTVDLGAAAGAVNRLDVGSLAADTPYYVYVIGDAADVEPTGFCVSTAAPATGPNLTWGDYDHYRWVGCLSTNGSSEIIFFEHVGLNNRREFWIDEHFSVVQSGSTAFQLFPVTRQPYVASQTKIKASFYTRQLNTVGGGGSIIARLTHDKVNFANGTIVLRYLRNSAQTTGDINGVVDVITDANGQFWTNISNANSQKIIEHLGYTLEV